MEIYRRVLRVPGFAVLIAATTLTRIPFAMNGLATILFLRAETGSFGTAGLAAGALALGAGIGAPLAARVVDRRGAVMLMPLALGHSGAILGLWALGSAGAPAAPLVGCALIAGICFPPSGSVLRSRWPEMMGGDADLLRGAFAFDSVTIEVSFVSGPLITAALVALIGPEAALVLASILVPLGTAVFIANLPDARRVVPIEDRVGGLGPMRIRAVRTLALSAIPFGFCIGTVEVAIPAFSEELGAGALAGILLAVWSLASGLGGLAFGARPPRRNALEVFLIGTLMFPLLCLPIVLASSPPVMAVLVMLSGTLIAPLIASRNQLMADVSPTAFGTEAFSWLMTSMIAGLSLGTAIAGAVVDARSWQTAVLIGAGITLAGSSVALLGRSVLRTEPATA